MRRRRAAGPAERPLLGLLESGELTLAQALDFAAGLAPRGHQPCGVPCSCRRWRGYAEYLSAYAVVRADCCRRFGVQTFAERLLRAVERAPERAIDELGAALWGRRSRAHVV